MAWVEDWDNFGPLYVYRPFLNELRIAIGERVLTYDPDDPSTTAIPPQKVMATEIEPLWDPANYSVATVGTAESFFTNFEEIMDGIIDRTGPYASLTYLQWWDESNWEGLAATSLPLVTEATLLTEIGAVSRLPPPVALDSDTVIPWMLQQYDLLNQLRWLRGDWQLTQSPSNNARQGNDTDPVFATADSNADSEYGAGTDIFTALGWPRQFQDASFNGTNYNVQYQTRNKNLRTTIYNGYKCDLDSYFYPYAEGPQGFDDFGEGFNENEMHLFIQETALGGTGGFGTTTHDVLVPADLSFSGRYTPDTPTLGVPKGTGWTFDSGPGGQNDSGVLKFDVVGGFSKIN
jgi:hypothetical protein